MERISNEPEGDCGRAHRPGDFNFSAVLADIHFGR